MVQQEADNVLLSVPTPDFIHTIDAEKRTLSKSSGNTLRMRRYEALPSATVPLGTSGVDPAYTPLSAVDIDAKPNKYGQLIRIEEEVTLQYSEDVLGEGATRMGVAMRQTEDELMRNALQSGATVLNAVHGVNGDNPTEITADDCSEVTRVLRANDAKHIMQSKTAMDRFGTGPVRPAYIAKGNTDLIGELEQVDGFLHASSYPNGMKDVPDAEYGAIENLRFYLSSIGSVSESASGAGADVYNIFVGGMESISMVEQDGASAQFIYNSPESLGGLRQNMEIGWKMMQVPVITNDLWVLRFRVTRRA